MLFHYISSRSCDVFDAIFDEFSSCYSYAKGPILCDDDDGENIFFFRTTNNNK